MLDSETTRLLTEFNDTWAALESFGVDYPTSETDNVIVAMRLMFDSAVGLAMFLSLSHPLPNTPELKDPAVAKNATAHEEQPDTSDNFLVSVPSPQHVAVDEIIAEELSELMEYRREVAGEVIGLTYPESTPDAWTQPATQDDLDYQESHYPPDFDDDSWDDDYDDYGFDHADDYGFDDDEEIEDDGPIDSALLDPLDGKCYCPYCNSECAPDYCYGCQSALLSPPVDLSSDDDTDTAVIPF